MSKLHKPIMRLTENKTKAQKTCTDRVSIDNRLQYVFIEKKKKAKKYHPILKVHLHDTSDQKVLKQLGNDNFSRFPTNRLCVLMFKNERGGRKVRICHSFTAFKTSYKIFSQQYKSI